MNAKAMPQSIVRNANDVVQGLWIGDHLTTMERLAIASFLANGHGISLYTYRDIVGLPFGVVVCDANEVIPEAEIFAHGKSGSYAVFADLFRYKLLFEKGGWWVDLDVVCLKHFDFDADYVFANERDIQGKGFVTNGIIKAPRQSQLMREALKFCYSEDVKNLPWAATGPKLLHRLVSSLDLAQYCYSSSTFCPISPTRWLSLVLPSKESDIRSSTYAVHLWNEMWRRYPLDKDEDYAPTSLYESLKRQYLGSGSDQLSQKARATTHKH
jgi:hypothetical protein